MLEVQVKSVILSDLHKYNYIMADEGLSAVEVAELPIVEEVKSGDRFIIENQDGTGIVDYKNFVIGLDNITFGPVLSAHGTDIGATSALIVALSAKFVDLQTLVNANSGTTGPWAT
jgi:hypothetical protein